MDIGNVPGDIRILPEYRGFYGTLSQSSAGSEFEGRHRAERVMNSEVPYVRYLIGRIVKTYDYINRVVLKLPLSVYEGTWTTLSPLVAMHHHDLACA